MTNQHEPSNNFNKVLTNERTCATCTYTGLSKLYILEFSMAFNVYVAPVASYLLVVGAGLRQELAPMDNYFSQIVSLPGPNVCLFMK